MDIAEARRTARAELADHAARLADAAEETADRAGQDREGGRDAGRMARAYRDIASTLDPVAFPRPARVSVPPANVIPMFETTADGRRVVEG